MPSIPIARYLVPADPPAPDDTFTTVVQALDRGLPAAVPLDARFDAALYVPTGEVRRWLDADPRQVVSASAPQTAPCTGAPDADAPAVPALLVLRDGKRPVATVPLAAGLRRRLPDTGDEGGALVELWIVSWTLHAGCLRGAGDYGSTVTLAWRRADAGATTFSPPALPPTVAARYAARPRYVLR